MRGSRIGPGPGAGPRSGAARLGNPANTWCSWCPERPEQAYAGVRRWYERNGSRKRRRTAAIGASSRRREEEEAGKGQRDGRKEERGIKRSTSLYNGGRSRAVPSTQDSSSRRERDPTPVRRRRREGRPRAGPTGACRSRRARGRGGEGRRR